MMEETHKDEILEQDSLISIPNALSQSGVLEQDETIYIPAPLFTQTSGRSGDEYLVQPTADCGWCEVLCQEQCEHNAECSCQAVCQTSCQYQSQCVSCETGCQSTCQNYCQTACEFGCQSNCESSCQETCQLSSQAPKVRSKISIANITTHSAEIKIIRNDATKIRVFVREDFGNEATVLDTGEVSIGQSSATHTLTGLSPNATYAYNLWDDIGGWIGMGEFTTLSNPRPKYWSWTNGLVSSKPATNALSSGDDIPAYLTAAGWTAFVQNIKDVYSYSMGASYLGTLSNGGNGTTKLSADMVNEAITAIGTMTSSYLPSKTTANVTKLSASLLNGLADSLNSIS